MYFIIVSKIYSNTFFVHCRPTSTNCLPLYSETSMMTLNRWRMTKTGKLWNSGVSRGVWGLEPPSPKFRVLTKANRIAIWAENVYCSYFNILISLKISEFRTSAPQDVWKKGSKILKLHKLAIVLHLQWQINWLSS